MKKPIGGQPEVASQSIQLTTKALIFRRNYRQAPFIDPGNLSRGELVDWLLKVANKLSAMESTSNYVESRRQDLDKALSNQKENADFLASALKSVPAPLKHYKVNIYPQ